MIAFSYLFTDFWGKLKKTNISCDAPNNTLLRQQGVARAALAFVMFLFQFTQKKILLR